MRSNDVNIPIHTSLFIVCPHVLDRNTTFNTYQFMSVQMHIVTGTDKVVCAVLVVSAKTAPSIPYLHAHYGMKTERAIDDKLRK